MSMSEASFDILTNICYIRHMSDEMQITKKNYDYVINVLNTKRQWKKKKKKLWR